MNSMSSSIETKSGNKRLYRTARVVLPIVSLLINLTIAVLIIQAIATGSPLSIWIIVISVGLIAGIVGLAVVFVTYRAVNHAFGEPGYRVTGKIKGQVISEAYGQSPLTLDLRVESGMGKIILES